MKKWVVALVIGLALLALGSGAGVNDNTIRCGSEIMLPSDTCEETRGGDTVGTKTYDEMKADKEAGQRVFNSWGRWALLGGGGVLAVLGIFGIVSTRRKRAAAGPTTADLHLAQQNAAQQAGYPRQQPVSGQLNQFAPMRHGPTVGQPAGPSHGGYPQQPPNQPGHYPPGRQQQPHPGPGYVPGQAEPRRPGQPDGPYQQGATPPPPSPPHPYDFGPGAGNHE